jgi:pimeloyl-ACP methyl ester carboxylesterase
MKTNINSEVVFYGTGSGAPPSGARSIVFVHGAGFDHSVWVMPARYFARHGFRVIAPDLPAHGLSSGVALASIEEMADWLAGLVTQECEGPATVVGHSMGSLVCMAFATRHPQLVEKVALLGTAAPMPVGPPLLDAAADNHHAAIDMANTWSHSAQGRMGAGQVPGLSNLISGERWLERMHDGVYHADLAACNAFTAQLDLGDIPTLVIIGEADQMTPAKFGNRVAGALQNAQTVTLKNCGHAMLSEQPNQVLDALKEFI